MKNEQSCQIWKLSSDKAEYERFEHLLSNDSSKNAIDRTVFNELLRHRALEKIEGEVCATVIHDPCSIRKAHSQKMEKLDRVLDLEGNVINGYRTFNSVLLYKSSLSLLGCHPYSQKEASEQENDHLTNKEVYQQVQAVISYEKNCVGEDFYNIVKINLFSRNGRAIFAKPMVLITNYELLNEEVALAVFQKYLKRSKIEGVFKFLKESLGWENFQIRNFQAIKNILLLGFFVGAYFCEREPELMDNPFVLIICGLAKNKGKISRHFFMKGLVVLAHLQMAQQFLEEQNLTKEQWSELMKLLE